MQPILRRILALILFAGLLAAAPASAVDAAGKPGGSTTSWKYTALGDSLATGFGARRGYVPRYEGYLETDTGARVSLTNLGQNGWTSGDLRRALENDPRFQDAVRGAKVVTWDIGGNDLRAARDRYKAGTCHQGTDSQDCLRAAVVTFQANWDAIVVQIIGLRATNDTVIRTMDVYNPYVDEDRAADSSQDDGGLNDFEVFKPYIDQINSYIATTATRTGHTIPYARVYQAFNGDNGDVDPARLRYLSLDGLHPNDTGHKVIADLLRNLGYAPVP